MDHGLRDCAIIIAMLKVVRADDSVKGGLFFVDADGKIFWGAKDQFICKSIGVCALIVQTDVDSGVMQIGSKTLGDERAVIATTNIENAGAVGNRGDESELAIGA